MSYSKIEWTEVTWNPTTGCTKISSGCQNCYAEKMAFRLQKMGLDKYKNGFDLSLQPECLNDPYTWKKPRMIFVNSMSDLFHEDIPLNYIKKVFKVMNDNSHHIFQVLTKRSDILKKYSPLLNWTPNIWAGVTIEDSPYSFRIDDLLSTDAKVKFISFEPLLGSVKTIELKGINWIIVGGESGPKARAMDKQWAIEIKDLCMKEKIPFFFKQWGGINKKKTGRILLGKTWDAMPYQSRKLRKH